MTGGMATIRGSSGEIALVVLGGGAPGVEQLLQMVSGAPDGVGFLLDGQGLAHRILHVPECLAAQLVEQREASLRRRREPSDQVVGEKRQRAGEKAERDHVDVLLMRIGRQLYSPLPAGVDWPAGIERPAPAPSPEVAAS